MAKSKETVAPDYPPIDTHFHPWTKKEWVSIRSLRMGLDKYLFHREFTEADEVAKAPTEDEMAQTYRKFNCVGTPVAWDSETFSGDPPTTNDYIAKLVKTYPDVFITGWACVDPLKGDKAVKEADRAINKLKLIGIKFQQATQGFKVNDPKYKPLWKLINEMKIPVQLHTGYTGLGTGDPGARGIKLQYNRPFPDMEDIACEYPDIKIFALHIGDPWTEEVTALARHCANVYRECSGMLPRYWPEEFWYEMNRRLQDKFVWGTDYPLFNLDILNELKSLKDPEGKKGHREGILEKVLWKNAITILGDDLKRVGVDLARWGVK